MKQHLSIECADRYKSLLGAYIVRGLSHRAIRVLIRPFYGNYVDKEALAMLAAEAAAKAGWKTIVVFPDMFDGEYAYTGNMTQFQMRNEFQQAKFLAPADFESAYLPKHLQSVDDDEGSHYNN